ncbi:hypothetical protein O181_082410 [Austropuccinia psidii MF-1]|uniref:Reverse transcriptase domain-containing protein n=1 Tax=Austropuccinia psidii MF-1 TaxID=1389203 RepID=A0A9Q3IKU1_9BASI|nr:hypothetical protein [Austropuccinia psidii MF-1]
MVDAIREHFDDKKDPKEEFLVEYQEERQLEIQYIHLEAAIPRDNARKNLCKHTQDAQTFLVPPMRRMAYIHVTAKNMTFCIHNAQQPLILDSGAHCSIVAREYLESHSPNWEKKLFPTKEKNFKSASGKMTSIGTTIKEIIIPHRKCNIRLKPELLVLEDANIQGFLLGKDHQRILLKILRRNGPAFSIGEEPLGKIRGYDTELYLNVERPYPPILRKPPYPEGLETTKETEKQINEPLDMDVIRKVGHNEMVEIVTPVLITWNDGKSRLFGDFRALNNYTKSNRYPIQSIPHALDKLEKAKHITKMDCMKGFHQNGVKPNSMKLLRIICHMGIYRYTRVPFGTKNSQLISKG